jgi:hypothetical protein
MTNYQNLNGQSNVAQFEIGIDFIDVQFLTTNKDGTNTYRYSYGSAGQNNVEEMKRLATQGFGLNSFIMTNVKNLYEKKR